MSGRNSPGGVGVEAVARQVLERRLKAEVLGQDAADQRPAPPTDRTVADPHVIPLCLDLEPNETAVAGAAIDLLHVSKDPPPSPPPNPPNPPRPPPNRLLPPITAAATEYRTMLPPSMLVETERSRDA